MAACLVASTAFAVMVPPLGGRDEPLHFLRAYQVSEGHFLAARDDGISRADACPPGDVTTTDDVLGARLPRALLADISALMVDGLFSDDHTDFTGHLGDSSPRGPRCFVDFRTTAVYPPLPYLPAAVGIAVARPFGASTLVMLYAARLATIVACVALFARALVHARGARAVFATVALLPVVVFQHAVISADAVTTALVVLAIALAWRFRRHPLSRALAVEASVVAIALAVAKPPAFLAIGALAIALRQPSSYRRTLAAGLAAALVALVGWTAWSSARFLPSTEIPLRHSYAYHDVDAGAQVALLVRRPWSLVTALARTMGHEGSRIASDAVAQVTGTAPAPAWGLLPAGALVVAALTVAIRVRRRERIGWALLAGSWLLVSFALAYVAWNAVGARRIDAFQGRYLVPAVPALALALGHARWRSDQQWTRAAVGLPLLVALLALFEQVRTAFYA